MYLLRNQREQPWVNREASTARPKARIILHLSTVPAMIRKKTANVKAPVITPRSRREAADGPWKCCVKVAKILANMGKGVRRPLS